MYLPITIGGRIFHQLFPLLKQACSYQSQRLQTFSTICGFRQQLTHATKVATQDHPLSLDDFAGRDDLELIEGEIGVQYILRRRRVAVAAHFFHSIGFMG